MKLERVAIVTLTEAVPWAPIVLGLADGLRANGIEPMVVQAVPHWFNAELVKRFEPHAVLVALHRNMLEHVEPWRAAVAGSIPFAALCFDDPYDMTTSLAVDRHFDLILTPEQCAVETYGRRGRVADLLLPTVADDWHHPPATSVPPAVDVLSVGGNQWRPRRTHFADLVRALHAAGRTYGEVAGNVRWIFGRDLTAALHQARLTFDMPRDEYTTDNPQRIPCTYVGPRVHIAAACGTPCLLWGPRSGAADTYPDAMTAPLGDGVATILDLLAVGNDRMAGAAAAALARFRSHHAPAVRGQQLADLLRRHLYGGRLG